MVLARQQLHLFAEYVPRMDDAAQQVVLALGILHDRVIHENRGPAAARACR